MKSIYLISLKSSVAKQLFEQNIKSTFSLNSGKGIFILDSPQDNLKDYLLQTVETVNMEETFELARSKK